ncbi:MAG TPA: Stk1 family PASTA domain-containing Ser/Thr kinase [Acidimicrobiales bacterium]|nr:Stk1 family PASTA domain-containing Ser/Thr kinase [Acidimicrobiales bacterium]
MADGVKVFSGRYEMVRQVARGGMADVYLARDLLLDRPVALKVLFRELSIDPAFVERFRREAQAAANLTHPSIVAVYDWGEEDGTYFIVMEYVDGRSLSTVLREDGALSPERAAAIGADVAGALAFAHRSGVVHRDVKPGNVLLDTVGHVKVADFGIARAINTEENLTQAGTVMGTATYFSPEQAQGHQVDQRSDVYSLGVVLYELVTGRPPFVGDNPVAIAYQHVRQDPVPPRDVNPAIPEPLEHIVLRAMAKDPAARYASADELRNDLLRFRQGRAVTATAPPPTMAVPTVAAAPVAPATASTTAVPRTRAVVEEPMADPHPPRRTGAYLALLFSLLGVLALLMFLLARSLGVVGGGDTGALVVVPTVVGDEAGKARETLRGFGFEVKDEVETNTADVGTVFKQVPEANTRLAQGETVTIYISKGESGIGVPDVVGELQDEGRRALERAGFEVRVENRTDRQVAAGTIVSQEPPGGGTAPEGSEVTIAVSSGKPAVQVPDVTNMDTAEASNRLGQEGFKTAVKREPSDDVEEGRVIRTDPAAGADAPLGSTVTMTVSSGPAEPEEVTVPDTVGMSEEEARNALTSAGFKVRSQDTLATSQDQDGKVLDQSPRGGRSAPKGSTVTIIIGRQATN